MKSERMLIALGFVLISVIWGSTWLAIKIGLESVPPFYGVALRFSAAIIILYLYQQMRGQAFPRDSASIKAYIVVAVLSFSFPFALVYWGEQYIPSGLASILFAGYPFVVALGSHFFLADERLNVFKVCGITLGFCGIVYIFWNDLAIRSGGGMGAILLSTLMQGTSLIIVKRVAKHLSAASLSLGGMMFGIVILYGLALTFEDFSDVHLDAKGLGSILYLGSFGTVVTFLTFYWLLKKVQAVYLSLVSLVTPVLAVILGAIWLDERLEPHVYGGAVVVLIGILIANGKDLGEEILHRKNRLFSA